MKELYKLAKDTYYKWAEQFPPNATITMNPEQFYREAYEAGFLKCREMALAMCERYPIEPGVSEMLEILGEKEI